jgi:hypothetical protein
MRLPLILARRNMKFLNTGQRRKMQSIVEQSSPSEEYLSDYAYIDSVRLSHYYGQLSKHGLVTQAKHMSKTLGKDFGNFKVKAVLAEGGGHHEVASEQSIETQVDPSFSRPQETLDALYDAGYIGETISNARIGSLVLAKGSLSVFDIRMMKEMWPFIGDSQATAETAHITNPSQRQKAHAAKKKEHDSNAKIIAQVPHSVQGTFTTDDGDAWFTLQPEYMRINPEDIVFKHGCDLGGEWHVLGIVDALPDHLAPDSDAASRVSSDIENALRFMLSMLRLTLGRPPHRYGITPIMIFRTMKKLT